MGFTVSFLFIDIYDDGIDEDEDDDDEDDDD